MRKLRWLVLAMAFSACTPGAFSAASSGGGPTGSQVMTIDVDLTQDPDGNTPGGVGGGYLPLVTAVQVGTYVRFHNSDGFSHTATSIAGSSFPNQYPFTSKALNQSGTNLSGGFSTGSLSSGSYSVQFLADTVGTYLFGCFYHYGTPMRAAIEVTSGTATPTPFPTLTPTPAPTPTPKQTPTPVPTPTGTPPAKVTVHIGFNHAKNQSQFGDISFYAPDFNDPNAEVIVVKVGGKVTFLNDDPSGTPHTASGLGSNGFPKKFDNMNGPVQFGTQIDGGLTWSSGQLNNGQSSQTFTVPVAGTYYFGCYFHFDSNQMRDVVVAE